MVFIESGIMNNYKEGKLDGLCRIWNKKRKIIIKKVRKNGI